MTKTTEIIERKKNQPHKSNGWQTFAAGGIAGAIDTSITMPLDTLKTKMQLTNLGPIHTAKQVIKSDGFAGFYYGFRPFIVQASGKAAVRFFAFSQLSHIFKDVLHWDQHTGEIGAALVCGLGAGVGEALMWTSPTERLKVLRQSQAGKGVGGASMGMHQILKEQGVRGLYVGAGATAARQATSVAVRFSMFGPVKRSLAERFGDDPASPSALASFIAGGCGGAVSVMLNNPIDVVKSRVQASESGMSTIGAARDIFRERGTGAFFAGLSARVPRLFVSQAIQFTIYDSILAMLNPTPAVTENVA